MIRRVLQTIGVSAVLIIMLALILSSTSATKVKPIDRVWDKNSTLGDMDAKRHYVMYTDVMCPYCDVFSRLIMENQQEFQEKYIEGKDILFEVRVTDFLYEYGQNQNIYSRQSAEAIACARRENRFWDYYHEVLNALWGDFQSKGIGDGKNSPVIKDLSKEYWVEIGKKIGLSSKFEDCFYNHETLKQVMQDTAKASEIINGLPYFEFGKYTVGGFDNNWGWDYVKRYLDAGL